MRTKTKKKKNDLPKQRCIHVRGNRVTMNSGNEVEFTRFGTRD